MAGIDTLQAPSAMASATPAQTSPTPYPSPTLAFTSQSSTPTLASTTSGVVAARVASFSGAVAEGTGEPTTLTGATSGPQLVLVPPGGGPGGVVLGSKFDKFTMEYVEGIALQNFDFVATLPQNDEMEKEGSIAWKTMRTRCQQMGFLIDEDEAWRFLGIPRMESAEPDKNVIKGRSGILKELLETVSDAALNPGEINERAKLMYKLAEKKDRCLKELPETLKLRRESLSGKDKLMRWAETDINFKNNLKADFEPGTLEALDLSNILKTNQNINNNLTHIDIAQARAFTGGLWKGGKEAVDIMKELQGREIIIWCPSGREDIGRMASAVVKATEAGINSTITVVIPLDPKPRCHQIEQYTDLWNHELISGKWAAFTKKVRFSAEPAKIIVSGNFAPMHQMKSLCLVSLSTEGGSGERSMLQSRGSIGALSSREVVIVDMAENEEFEFIKHVGAVKEDIIESWHGPSRAPSSKPGEKRILYAGVVKQAGGWAGRMAVMKVKEHMIPLDIIVGLHSTFGNPDSLLIDISGPGAGTYVQQLSEDAVMISSKLMVARSTASEKQWKQKTEELYNLGGEYIEKVRYRASQGGNTIAIPPILQEQKEMRRKESKEEEGRMTQVVVRLRGEFIEAQESQIQKIVKMFGEATQLNFEAEESPVVASRYQWKKIKDSRTGWKGDILFKVKDTDEIFRMFRLTEGKTIELGDEGKVTIEIIPHAKLVIEARNKCGPI